MSRFLQRFGHYWLGLLERLGRATLFMVQMIGAIGSLIKRPGLLVAQLRGSVGQEERIGTLVALTLVRELGPVVTGLLFAGRAGSAMTAEIGLMKATEQLSGLEMMAVDPFRRVFAPRFLAGFLSLPMLAAMFSAVGVAGSQYLRERIVFPHLRALVVRLPERWFIRP